MLAVMLLAFACNDDGEKIYLSGLEASQLILTETDVVLSKDNAATIVLSAAWKNSTLVVSHPDMKAPSVFKAYLQLSTTDDFSSNVVEIESSSESKAFTGLELNAQAKALGLTPDVVTPVYIRLRGSMGANVESVYSEVKTVNITPYLIDMTLAFVLNTEKKPTGQTLASTGADGIYRGFIGAAGWDKFFMEEGDGTVWGNPPQDGSSFYATSQADSWNFWYPEPSGCYYTEVNTIRGIWSAIYLPVINVTGDIEGKMNYDRTSNRWTYVFDASTAGSVTIRLSGTGDLYNHETGDASPAADKVTIAFAPGAEGIVRVDAAQDISVVIPVAGESTLILNLNDPKNWTCEVISGIEEPEAVAPEIYLLGVDDGFVEEAQWNFDNKLLLYNEENLAYAGVVNVNSLWGYQIAIEKDNWNDVYKLGEGDALTGSLVFKGEANLPAPAPGLYFFDVSIKALSYKLTAIGEQIYVTGLNDNWEFTDALQATYQAGVYSGTFSITQASTYGFKIYPQQGNWDIVFGGADGKLVYGAGDIPDSKDWEAGTYTITVNLISGTYSIQ